MIVIQLEHGKLIVRCCSNAWFVQCVVKLQKKVPEDDQNFIYWSYSLLIWLVTELKVDEISCLPKISLVFWTISLAWHNTATGSTSILNLLAMKQFEAAASSRTVGKSAVLRWQICLITFPLHFTFCSLLLNHIVFLRQANGVQHPNSLHWQERSCFTVPFWKNKMSHKWQRMNIVKYLILVGIHSG